MFVSTLAVSEGNVPLLPAPSSVPADGKPKLLRSTASKRERTVTMLPCREKTEINNETNKVERAQGRSGESVMTHPTLMRRGSARTPFPFVIGFDRSCHRCTVGKQSREDAALPTATATPTDSSRLLPPKRPHSQQSAECSLANRPSSCRQPVMTTEQRCTCWHSVPDSFTKKCLIASHPVYNFVTRTRSPCQ